MHAAWFTAAVPDAPTVVLQLRLRPYSLGHEILLTRLGSPFVQTSAQRDLSDPLAFSLQPSALLLAALICSQTYEDACRTLHSPFLDLFLRLWRLRLRFRPSFSLQPLAFSLSPSLDWTVELLAFARYCAAGKWMPETNQPKSTGGRSLKSPWPFRLAAILMRDLGLSEREALDIPMARAAAYYAALGDLEGTVDLFGASDQALLDMLERLKAKG